MNIGYFMNAHFFRQQQVFVSNTFLFFLDITICLYSRFEKTCKYNSKTILKFSSKFSDISGKT